MFSLKYKNLIKDTLFENNSNTENSKVYESIMNYIHNFPIRFDDNVYVSNTSDDNSLILYVLTSLDYEHRLQGNALKDNDIEIVDKKLDKNDIILYQYYKFSIFIIENHHGTLSFDKSKQRIRYVYNPDYKSLLNDNEFRKNFNIIEGNKRDVGEFIDNYIKINFKIKIVLDDETEKPSNNKEEKTPFKVITNKQIQNDIDIIKSDDDIETTDDKTSVYNNISDDEKEYYMYGKNKNKEPTSVRFIASKLINDTKWRKVNDVKLKVQSSLKDFRKLCKEKEPLLASDILFSELELASNGNCSNTVNFENKDNVNVDNTLLYLTKDPTEILSPMVILEMDNALNWSSDKDGKSAKYEIQNVFGSEQDFKNGVIMYPLESNEKLVDSYAIINNKKLGISTKGGKNGLGAAASLSSIFSFLIDDTNFNFNGYGYNDNFQSYILRGIENVITNKHNVDPVEFKNKIISELTPHLSTYGLNLVQSNDELIIDNLVLLFLFGGTQPINHELIFKFVRNYGLGNMKFKSNNLTNFAKEITSDGLTKLIMGILDKYKYKFCQVNMLPKITENTFKYTYNVQYPAKFSGNVVIKHVNKGLRFSIQGEKI